MKTGFVYWHPMIYQFGMRLLYGKNFLSRYETISDLLPENVSVVDLCCGDCYMEKILRKKRIDYLGVDLNPAFIKHALKRGIKAQLIDIEQGEIPKGDYIIMQVSLYQFMPNHRALIDKMFASANKGVIISEPTRHVSSAKNPLVSLLGILATRVNSKDFPNRLTKIELLDLFNEYKVSSVKEINGGRDLIGLFIKKDS